MATSTAASHTQTQLDTADHGLELASAKAKQWIKDTVETECARIKAAGSRAIPLPLKNCGIVLEELDGKDPSSARPKKRKIKVINRLEIASGMDFDRVSQIMISEPIVYPFREGYQYVHVLAFTQSSNEMALLIPYLYAPYLTSIGEDTAAPAKKQDKDSFVNSLQDWLFLNERHERSLHHVDAFHAIS